MKLRSVEIGGKRNWLLREQFTEIQSNDFKSEE